MSPIRVLLAEDHVLIRAGIRALLQNIEGIQVVAEADDGHDVPRLVKMLQPDVVLMDIGMAGLNGLEATARVAEKFPKVRVLILSMHKNEEYVLQALRVGASGYLLKSAAVGELELAVRAVARGETYLCPAVSKYVISEYMRRIGGETRSSPGDRLTPRHREILRLIAEGRSTREIARLLNISVKTSEAHRAALMERLGIHDVAGLVRYAIQTGIVTPET